MPDTQTQVIKIQLNGETRTVTKGLSVLQLFEELGIAPDRVALELDRSIVRRPDWGTTPVEDGAKLEVVQFVGGG